MPGTLPLPAGRPRIEVVAAVMVDETGQFLLAQRPVGKAYAGYWEFPGGKVETGEAAVDALRRELREELGIDALTCYPWLTRDFDYSHADVRLRFFRVTKWSGRIQGRENQAFVWQTGGNVTVAPLLPANGPILQALELPPIYGITCAGEVGSDRFLDCLEQSLRGGLRLIQVREKQFNDDDLRVFAAQVVALSRRYGARIVVNGPVEIAHKVHADGLHLSSMQLMSTARRPEFRLCGASCHDATELDRARDLGMDFVVLGPVNATPTHANATLLGWHGLAEMIRDYPLPVYALGGMRITDLEQAACAGAHGLAMMRGAWVASASGRQDTRNLRPGQ